MSKLVYFMRKSDRVVERWHYVNSTKEQLYLHKYFISFLVPDHAAEWIEEQSKTHHCKLKIDNLKETMDANGLSHAVIFTQNEEYAHTLDLSNQALETLKTFIDYAEVKSNNNGGLE